MAERPVFFNHAGRAVSKTYPFEWFPGFAVSQKQKSIESLHNAILQVDTAARPLEISTKSKDPVGIKLSAFNLRLNNHILENIFQSAKVFENGGPYLDLLEMLPKEAKRDKRLSNSGSRKVFRYKGEDFPLIPKTVFYDYIYIHAVKESLSTEEVNEISKYNYFTDIEFNPMKSINTQARTVSLIRVILEEYGCIPDFPKDDFIQYHKEHVVY